MMPRPRLGVSESLGDALTDQELLDILKHDLRNDVATEMGPVSSLNYIWVTVQCLILFSEIERELKQLRNPLWVEAYETNPRLTKEKRSSLTLLSMAEENVECMKVMAEMFEKYRAGFMQHIYWDDLESPDAILERKGSDDFEPSCTVM